MDKTSQVIHRLLAVYIVVMLIIIGVVIGKLVRDEVQTSKYQARYLSEISKQLSYKLESGPSTSIRYPEAGPYDQRLGYTLLPEEINRLTKLGFSITAQAAVSPMMMQLADDYGLFTIYHEKSQAGLNITDKTGKVIFNTAYPAFNYPNFDTIPPLILQTLLYIENRELLSEQNAQVNPAIEWDRLGFAALQMMAHKIGAAGNVAGGSTLATQLEKYRHSPNGFTNSMTDKFHQMGTASLRAYMKGQDTRAMRQEIALSYLNSMPLAATPKLGEVHGLGDGLSAWFGTDFNEVNRLLSQQELNAQTRISRQQAQIYRQVLNILLSQRRPSYFLGKGFDALQNLTDSYLRLMAEQGIISPTLRDATLKVSVARTSKMDSDTTPFVTEKKTQSVLRTRLAKMLGAKSNYELDRIDLTAKTTLDFKTQQSVTVELRSLNQSAEAQSIGIFGKKMLSGNVDLSPVTYSLMLFERNKIGNLLRVQTDNYDNPLDINEGIRIDLGSTAKLRTMVHYLEIITDVYKRYKNQSAQELSQLDIHPRDYLSAWVIEQLRANPKISLEELLDAALNRKYSASSGEAFFTGGGIHTFSNFSKSDNSKILTVRQALRDSVNLVFIRMMREEVYYHLYRPEGIARWLESPDDPKRKEYLQQFADKEGRVYLQRFYNRYKEKSAQQALEMLSQRVLANPARQTMLYRSVYPNRSVEQLEAFLTVHLSKAALAGENIQSLYDKYSIEKFDLQDQGYITKIHPLELWLVRYLTINTGATLDQALAASTEQRQNVYRWLFSSRRHNAQQRRIMTLLEQEAFKEIHHAWKRLGYPFGALTPSYATAIGASGDRPAALAELTGILLNDGIKLPVVRFQSLHFAEGTPYETLMDKSPSRGRLMFPAEIAKAARSAMVGVVEGGTASRVHGAFHDADGKPLTIGGKTGTGDHRKE
ncbi:MAG: transglycosylase domain-containing protein, partial [Methylococcales bacterium]|nr:transglycosylase domain-containing protein [Methylococcales bacterium]